MADEQLVLFWPLTVDPYDEPNDEATAYLSYEGEWI